MIGKCVVAVVGPEVSAYRGGMQRPLIWLVEVVVICFKTAIKESSTEGKRKKEKEKKRKGEKEKRGGKEKKKEKQLPICHPCLSEFRLSLVFRARFWIGSHDYCFYLLTLVLDTPCKKKKMILHPHGA